MEVKIIEKEIQVKALVESQTYEGAYYITELEGVEWTCTCPHYMNRQKPCKHIEAVKEEVSYD